MSSSKIVAVVGAWAHLDSGAVPLIVLGARAVLRAAFLLARLDGFGTPVGGVGDGVDLGWMPVVELMPWAAVLVGAGLVARLLIRARAAGAGVWAGVRSGAAGLACVIAVVWATDGLSGLVLGRREWVETVEAIVDRPSTTSIGASGSMVGGVEVVAWLGFGAGALIVLVEMIIRLAAVVLLAVAVPVMATGAAVRGSRTGSSRTGSSRPSSSSPSLPPSPPVSWLSSAWSARLLCALRWSVVAVLVKPILLLALVIGVVELAPAGAWLALVGGVSVTGVALFGPVTLFRSLALAVPSFGGGPVRLGWQGLSQPQLVGPRAGSAAAQARVASGSGVGSADSGEHALVAATMSSSGRRRGGNRAGRSGLADVIWPVVREVDGREPFAALAPKLTAGEHVDNRLGEEHVLVGDGSGLVTTRLPGLQDAADRVSARILAAGDLTTEPVPIVPPLGARPGRRPAAATPTRSTHNAAATHTATATATDADIDAVTDVATATGVDVGAGAGTAAAEGAMAGRGWTLNVLGRPTLHAAPVGRGGEETGSARTEMTARLSPRMVDLLVFLALHPHGIRRDAVVAALWPETGRRRPANNLSALLARLRSAVAEHNGPSGAAAELVSADGETYRLDPEQVRVDWWDFLAASNTDWAGSGHHGPSSGSAAEGPAVLHADVVAALHTAHELYRGPLADGMGAEWVLSLREAARRSFLDVTARLVRHHVAQDPAAALRVLEKARNLDPTNENLYRDIIALQLKTGDNDGAANTLRLLEAQLADIEETVSDATLALAQQISDGFGHPD